MASIRKSLNIIWRLTWRSASTLLILLALMAGLLKILTPYASHYEDKLREYLEANLPWEVQFSHMETRWQGLAPLISLNNVVLQENDETPLLHARKLALHIDPLSWLSSGGKQLYELQLHEALLAASNRSGNWQLQLPGSQKTGAAAGLPAALSGIRLVNCQLLVDANRHEFPVLLDQFNVLLRQDEQSFRAGGTFSISGTEESLEFRIHAQNLAGLPKGKIYLNARQLEMSDWLNFLPWIAGKIDQGRLDMETWLDFEGSSITELQSEFRIKDWVHSNQINLNKHALPLAIQSYIEKLEGNILFQQKENTHSLEISNLTIQRLSQTEPAMTISARWDKTQASLKAMQIDLASLDNLARILGYDRALSSLGLAYEQHPRGQIPELLLQASRVNDKWTLESLATAVQNLSVNSVADIPGFSNLNAQLKMQNDILNGRVNSDSLSFDYPKIFREVLFLDHIDAEFQYKIQNKIQELNFSQIEVASDNSQLLARLRLLWNEGSKKPEIDLMADIRDLPISETSRYWPANAFNKNLLAWLDRSLIGGQVKNAVAILKGDLNDWPFKHNEGLFNIRTNVEDATLAYHPKWPEIDQLDARVEFTATGMSLETEKARILGNHIRFGQASIPEFKNPVVNVELKGEGTLNELREVLARSPVEQKTGTFRDKIKLAGEGKVDLDLRVPLRDELGSTRLNGTLALVRNRISLPAEKIELNELEGKIIFSESGFTGENLQSSYRGTPSKFSVAVGSFTRDSNHAAELSLSGVYKTDEMIREYLPDWRHLTKNIYGESPWTVHVGIPGEISAPYNFLLESELAGTMIDLPMPLWKARDQQKTTRVEFTWPLAENPIRLSVGSAFFMRMKPGPDDTILSSHIQLGGQPDDGSWQDGIHLRGHTDTLDISSWLAARDELFTSSGEPSSIDLESLNLRVRSLNFADKIFDDVELKLALDDDYWLCKIFSTDVQGQVRFTRNSGPGESVLAEFQRLYIPEESVDSSGTISLGAEEIPRLHLYARELKLGDILLGESRLEATPIPEGLHLETLESKSDSLELRASGDWLSVQHGNLSRFKINMTSESLGNMLDNFGYSGVVKGGQSIAEFDVSWPGTPLDFKMAKLSGKLNVEVGSGRFLEVDPGAGRILGLLSMSQLPKRLLLDFSDLFSKGMGFDSINGHFSLDDGLAITDDLLIKSSSARIQVNGSTDLDKREYDQTLLVIPSVGQTLPIVGALAAGAAGAAYMLAVQGILGRSLNESNRFVYKVTGSWDDPVIERIEQSKTEQKP